WLGEHVDYLDDLVLDALLAEETRPRLMEHKDGALLILRGVNLNEDAKPEDMISIRMWIDSQRIITIRRRKLRAVQDIHQQMETGGGPKNAADFLVSLTTRLFQRMEPTLVDLDQHADDIEERVLDNPDTSERQEIVDIRKQTIELRRYIAPQKDIISYLRTSNIRWLDEKHRRQLQENQDRLTRYVEELDAIRERSQIIKDELANALADRMNKNMYVLSIIAAIFLPLGFLTGLLGINVGGMPGAEYDLAFWIVCGLCVAFSALLLWIFRLLKWL
ncbi:MAG TPA: zinc transporter ZntB, partial [Rhodospirillaceae bacterium]|nr:zinc transporter ZntB [Rhodospirillaceae bacterium]